MQPLRISALMAALLASAIPAMAQYAPQSNTLGNNSTLDQQVIGDTISTADRTNSVSTQLGNSANANGAQVNPTIDTRDQNTVTSTGGAGGSATGNLSNNDNRSNASNGNQSMGQANTGNSSVGNTTSSSVGNILGGATSSSGCNILGGATSGGNTLTNGSNTATNTAFGGSGGTGGQGGAGGTASSNGTNLGINGQQQGIDRSGNSTNTNANTSTNRNTNAQGQGQGQGQQQAATAAQGQGQQMGQGQNSDNRNSVSGGNQRTSTNVGGQSANTQSGVGQSGNSAVAVDASNRSVSTNNVDARSLYIPQVVAATPPSVVPSATAVAGVMNCGPLQQVVRTPVVGKFYGFFSDNDVPQGWTEDLVPYTVDANGAPVAFDAPGAVIKPYHTIGGKPFGHIVLTNTAVVGVSGGRNLAIGGGGGSNMSWGQAGGGSSGASQRLVTTIQLRLCQIEEKPTQVIFEQAKPVQPTISRIAE